MRRLSRIVLVTIVIAAMLAAGAMSAADPAGPKCTDITFGDAGYIVPLDGSAASMQDAYMTLAAPACPVTAYKLHVLNGDTGTEMTVLSGVVSSTDATKVTFPNYTLTSQAPSFLCIYGETLWRGRVADRAPDDPGCMRLNPNDFGGGSGFN